MLFSADSTPDHEFDAFLRRALNQYPQPADAARGWQLLLPRLAWLTKPETLTRAQAEHWLRDRPGPPLVAGA